MNTLIHNADVALIHSSCVQEHVDIVIQQGRIRGVTPMSPRGAARLLRDRSWQVYDARGWIVLPGLVNTHLHSHQVILRGLEGLQHATLQKWLSIAGKSCLSLTSDDCRVLVECVLLELAYSGCTATVDMPWVVRQDPEGILRACVRGAQDVGLRYVLVRSAITTNRFSEGLSPELVEKGSEFLKSCRWAATDLAKDVGGDRISVAIGPSNIYSSTLEEFQACAEMAEALQVGMHFHFLESESERPYLRDRLALEPSEFLRVCGIGRVFPRWVAHCVHATQETIATLGDMAIGVASCPTANGRGEGIAPITEMLDAGVKVGVGVDGPASNDACHMLSELKVFRTIQGARGTTSYLKWYDTVRAGTEGGAAMIGLSPGCGTLLSGAPADLAAFDIREDVSYAGNRHGIIALLSCTPRRPELLMVDGEVLVERGKHRRVDEKAVVAAVEAIATRVAKG